MAKTEGKYIFSFNNLKKNCRRSKSQLTLSFQEFEQGKSLCVVSQLDAYIERSEPCRQDLHFFPKPKCPDCLLSRFLKEGTG